MSDLNNKEISQEIEKALSALEKHENELASTIRPILLDNLKRGRIESFIQGDLIRVSDYVLLVAEKYKRLHTFINQLQVERTDEVWGTLFHQMQRWAYSFLIKKNFYSGQITSEIATECAADAVLSLFHTHFPYDTEVKPWVYVIVVHTCQKYIQKQLRSDTLEANLIDLNDALNVAGVENQIVEYEQWMLDEVRYALEKLSPQRRRIIESLYFSELSVSEIAKEANKSVGAIYSLHFNALNNLRETLSNLNALQNIIDDLKDTGSSPQSPEKPSEAGL